MMIGYEEAFMVLAAGREEKNLREVEVTSWKGNGRYSEWYLILVEIFLILTQLQVILHHYTSIQPNAPHMVLFYGL